MENIKSYNFYSKFFLKDALLLSYIPENAALRIGCNSRTTNFRKKMYMT